MPSGQHPWEEDEDKRDRNPLKGLPPIGEFDKPPEAKEQPAKIDQTSNIVNIQPKNNDVIDYDRINSIVMNQREPKPFTYYPRSKKYHIMNRMHAEILSIADFAPSRTWHLIIAQEIIDVFHSAIDFPKMILNMKNELQECESDSAREKLIEAKLVAELKKRLGIENK